MQLELLVVNKLKATVHSHYVITAQHRVNMIAICIWSCLVVVCIALVKADNHLFNDYIKERLAFTTKAESLSINEAWVLTPQEEVVDKLLNDLKQHDLSLDPVPVQFNFITMQDTIASSKLFEFLKSFPKGALLHSHDVSTIDMHFYVNASYIPGCLYGIAGEAYGNLAFTPLDGYVPIEEVRSS